MRNRFLLQLTVLFSIAIFSVVSCTTRIKDGYYTCDPNEPGACPEGWVCQMRGTDGVHRCYARAEAWCGDGVRDPMEECDGLDMGNFTCETGYALCLGNCKGVCTECGNGRIELDATGEGEECDDGNTVSGDGCSADCHIEHAYCQDPGEYCLQWCGDGIINGPELCEASNLAGYSCTDFGYLGGELHCSADCRQLDLSGCAGYCGDGLLQSPEACDGMNMPAATCRDFLYTGGTLGCSSGCTLSQEACFSSWQRQDINTTGNVMAIHETPDGAIFAVSFNGWVGRYSQGSWTQWQMIKDPMLRTVFAFSGTDAWAGGNFGALYHFDGTDWTRMAVAENIHITGIWGAAPDDIHVCGFTTDIPANAVIMHFDGANWTDELWLIDMIMSFNFMAIHGTAADDVWVVGYPGIVLHFDGAAWQPATLPPEMQYWDFRFVTTVGGTRLFSGFTDTGVGFILQEDNGTLTPLPITTTSRVVQVRGEGMDALWALLENGSILRREEAGWRTVSPPVSSRVHSLWSRPDGTLWVGGANGILYHYVGEFETLSYAFPQNILRIWGPKPGDLYVTGQTGAMRHLSNGAWQTETPAPGMVVQDIWGPDENLVFAVGNAGKAAVRANGVWSEIPTGVTLHLRAVHGCGPDDVWAVGMNGLILHYSQGAWTDMTSSLSTETLNDVYCISPEAVFAVGTNGTILFFNGTAWTSMQPGTGENLNAVWASSSRHVFAVGNNGLILFYDGTAWSQVPSGVGMTLRDIDGTHARDIWVVGTGGVVLHYDGVRFSPVSVPGNPSLSRVHVQSDRLLAVSGMSILEYRYRFSLPPDTPGPCPSTVPLYCQETRIFDTHRMPGRIDAWGTLANLSGPETAFRFQAPFSGQFTWTMHPSTPHGRIVVMRAEDFDACDTASVLQISTLVNSSQMVSLQLERNESVVLVIDSATTESGALQVECHR